VPNVLAGLTLRFSKGKLFASTDSSPANSFIGAFPFRRAAALNQPSAGLPFQVFHLRTLRAGCFFPAFQKHGCS